MGEKERENVREQRAQEARVRPERGRLPVERDAVVRAQALDLVVAGALPVGVAAYVDLFPPQTYGSATDSIRIKEKQRRQECEDECSKRNALACSRPREMLLSAESGSAREARGWEEGDLPLTPENSAAGPVAVLGRQRWR